MLRPANSKVHPLIWKVLSENPHTLKSNTEACIAVWEEVAKVNALDLNDWFEVKQLMRSKNWQPESITRQKRKYNQETSQSPTLAQQEREYKFSNGDYY